LHIVPHDLAAECHEGRLSFTLVLRERDAIREGVGDIPVRLEQRDRAVLDRMEAIHFELTGGTVRAAAQPRVAVCEIDGAAPVPSLSIRITTRAAVERPIVHERRRRNHSPPPEARAYVPWQAVEADQNSTSWNHVSLWLRRLQVAFHHLGWTG